MISYETRLKSWGNSIGIVVPKGKLRESEISENAKVKVTISPVKTITAGDLFGSFPGIAKNLGSGLREIDREFEGR